MNMRTLVGISVMTFLGGAVIGCDDPVAPIGQGAVQLFVAPALKADLKEGESPCQIAQQTFKIGSVDALNRASIADGNEGVAVGCTVRASGAGFNISGNASKASGSFGVSGYVETGKTTEGEGTLSIDANLFGGNTKCTLAVDRTIEGSQLAIGPGRVWARISCPRLELVGISPTQVCKAEGYIVFENCSELPCDAEGEADRLRSSR